MRRTVKVTIRRDPRRRKDGSRPWMVCWVDPETLRPKSATGYRTKELAEIARRAKERELFSGETFEPIPWGAFVAKYLANLETEGRHNTARNYRTSLERFGRMASPARPDTVTRSMVLEHKAGLFEAGLSKGTVAKAMRTLKAALSMAMEYGHATKNPLKGMRSLVPAVDERIKPQITADEYARVLAAADAEAETVITVARDTGLRAGELAHLQWPDVDLDTETPRLYVNSREGAETKSKKARPVELFPETAQVLRRWRDDTGALDFLRPYVFPMAGIADHRRELVLSKRVAAVFRAAGVGKSGDGLHWLRSCHSTDCLNRGMAVHAVQRRLGHKSPVTTLKHYANAGDGEQREAIKRRSRRA